MALQLTRAGLGPLGSCGVPTPPGLLLPCPVPAYRIHQFEKVEQFAVTSPDDNASWEMMDQMLTNAEDFYKAGGAASQFRTCGGSCLGCPLAVARTCNVPCMPAALQPASLWSPPNQQACGRPAGAGDPIQGGQHRVWRAQQCSSEEVGAWL